MRKGEIVDIIKKSSKFSKLNLEFNDYNDYIIFNINDKSYKIELFYNNGKYSFYYHDNKLGISPIEIKFNRINNGSYVTEDKILSKFGEEIRAIQRLHEMCLIRKKDSEKVANLIRTYIKKEYQTDADFNYIRFSFPETFYKQGRIYRKRNFDFIKEKKIRNVKYEIVVFLKEDYRTIRLSLNYDNSIDKLTLTYKYENFENKDITKIIRSQKLKKIMFNEEELDSIGN